MDEEKMVLEMITLRQDVDEIKEILRTDMVTKDEFLASQDKMMQILVRLDNERAANAAANRRQQDILDTHEEKIAEHEVAIHDLRLQVAV